MGNPYNAYRGRKSWLRRVLIAIVILLVIALAAAIVGLFVLPNYVVYTSDGPQLVLPFFGSSPTDSPTPTPTTTAEPSDVVIESASPSPSAAVTPPRAPASLPARRTAPLGLVGYEFPRLLDGSAAESLASGRGGIFPVTADDLADPDLTAAAVQEGLPYAAALVVFDPADPQTAIALCQTAAARGFDEVILTQTADAAEADTVSFFTALREGLEDYGFNGMISLVAEREPFQNDTAVGRAAAAQFDRLYVPGGNWGGLNLYQYLKDNGFRGTTADIVTRVSSPISANYSWAILP